MGFSVSVHLDSWNIKNLSHRPACFIEHICRSEFSVFRKPAMTFQSCAGFSIGGEHEKEQERIGQNHMMDRQWTVVLLISPKSPFISRLKSV